MSAKQYLSTLVLLGAMNLLTNSSIAQTISKGASPAQAVSASRLQVDAALPEYRRAEGINGKLTSVGSSALTQLLNLWAVTLKRLHPALEFEVIGGGSGTAPPALLEGKSELAPMSRPMNANERNAFRTKFGYEPTQVTVGVDALAILVNKNNPLKQISLQELDAIYSTTPKRGGTTMTTWGQLGLTGEWAEQSIQVYGPQSTQGMYALFRADVLQGGEYRYDMRTEPVASGIAQSVGAHPHAIGFASHVFTSARARALAVSRERGGNAIEPTQTTAASGEYPLARNLYIYVNRKPGTALSPALNEFLRFVCSKQGQAIAVELGNYPLSAALSDKECMSALN
ncbi:MAG: PstS family phosphate ABC transporter substrate-binding protein [Casimicrobium sp.]